jgi:hypothetical protein
MVNRSGSGPVPDEVEVVRGDAADARFTIDVTRGAQVIYQPSTLRTRVGWRSFQRSKPASLPPRKPTGPGLSAWRTSTCMAARLAGH